MTRIATNVMQSRWLLWTGFVAATLAVYYPAWHGGMLWDDNTHLTRMELQSFSGLWHIWFSLGATQQYYPLTHSAFWLMHSLFGDDTLAYHLLNITLHATSAFLAVMILRRLSVPGAVLAGVIFALHPVHVESVAWMTELKNTLSGVCYLGALLAYLDFDRTRRPAAYWAALALFVLALLSKSVTATLPAVLLVIFWWKRGRLDWERDVAPLVPWLAGGVGAGVFTSWVERTQIGAQGSAFTFSLVERGLIAGRVICFYLAKLFWPAPLVFNYARWHIDARDAVQYLYPIAVAGLVAALWWLRRRSAGPLAAVLIFCGTLVPVLGFVNVYPFVFSFVADHFQYLASLAIIALVSAGLMWAAQRFSFSALRAQAAAIVIVGAPLAMLTWHQAHQYADALTLYRATLARNPTSLLAHNNLGALELEEPGAQVDDAISHLNEALRLDPKYVEAHVNLGVALQQKGRLDEAIAQYREALKLAPGAAKARQNLGLALLLAGRKDEAAPYLMAAQKDLEGSTEPEVHISLGDSLMGQKQPEAALTEYEKAGLLLSEKSGRAFNRVIGKMAEAHNDVGIEHARAGRTDEAIKEYREAIALRPKFASAQNNLGYALFQARQLDEAVMHLQEAVRLQPDYIVATTTLGEVLLELGRNDEVVEALTNALAFPSGRASPEVHNDFGVALGRLGRLDAAVPHFQEAIRLKPDFENAKVNLSRVLAALGRGK